MPDDFCDLWEQALRSVFETKQPCVDRVRLRGPGRSAALRHPAGSRVQRLRARPSSSSGVTQDVTDRKWAEEALKKADRRKDEFLATLAHELRNPLAPLRSGLHVLNISRDPAVAVDTRKMMDRQLSHMVRLIDDLLDASRITNDKLTLRKERVSLQAVVETAVEASRPVIDASRHALKLALPEEPLWLDADPTRLAQVVSNLLTNAAKYTPEGGSHRTRGRTGGRGSQSSASRTPGSASRPGCWPKCSRCSPR